MGEVGAAVSRQNLAEALREHGFYDVAVAIKSHRGEFRASDKTRLNVGDPDLGPEQVGAQIEREQQPKKPGLVHTSPRTILFITTARPRRRATKSRLPAGAAKMTPGEQEVLFADKEPSTEPAGALPGDEVTGGARSLLAAALRLATWPCLRSESPASSAHHLIVSFLGSKPSSSDEERLGRFLVID
jgi:hypothetical protein